MNGSLRFLGLVLFALSPALAQSDAFVQQRAAARTALVRGLLDLATWCESKQLFLERERLYARVIAVDPENADARKGLRYKRGRAGAWIDPPPLKMSNRDAKALLDLPPKLEAVIVPFSDAMLELVDGANGDASQRQNVYDEILAIDAEEPRVHERLGDVKVGDKWILKETAVAKEQRDKIKAQVKTCMAEVPKGDEEEPGDDEVKLARTWKSALATHDVRVLSTGERDECERLLQVTQVAGALIDGLLGDSVSYPDRYTIYLLARSDEKLTFVQQLPGLSSGERQNMLATVGGGVPNSNNVVVWDPDPKIRLDLSVRCTYGNLLRSTYGISPVQGFAFEGLGLYLTREILGTRLTWWTILAPAPRGEFFGDSVIVQDAEAQATRARLMLADSNWFSETLKLYESGKAPHLAQVTKRHLDKMGVGDILVAYSLTAYMLEGQPENASRFYSIVGSGDGAEAAAKKTLDLTLPQLEKRLHRWLRERR